MFYIWNFVFEDLGTPLGTGTQNNKKKRKFVNASDIGDLLSPRSPYAHGSKRQSREGRLSTISSATFDSSLGSPFCDSPDIREPCAKKVLTARHQTCLELQQTEQNYVKVLETIIMVCEWNRIYNQSFCFLERLNFSNWRIYFVAE